MKYCAQCNKSYPNKITVCPNDGSSLTDADSTRKHSVPSLEIGVMEESLPIDFRPEEESLLGNFKIDEDSIFTQIQSQSHDATTKSIIGQTIDGKYRVESLIGMGGMGAVYRARHTFINNEVAIKVIRPREGMSNKTAERFLREARAAGMIDHPNAIKVTDFGHSGEMLYLVMEFVQGQSLDNLIQIAGHLSPELTAEIMGQICAALDAAHSRNIVHRDLKPENIMIKQNDLGQRIVKVLDFGLAKLKAEEDFIPSLTSADTVVGTLSYMSPEQCKGEEVLDLRSDIYSLGVVAFEMLTGKLPFVSTRPTGLLSKHMFDHPPRLRSIKPSIPENVERAVLRAMAKSPEDRFQSAGEFASELSKAVRTSQESSSRALSAVFDKEETDHSHDDIRTESLNENITTEIGRSTVQSFSYEVKHGNSESKPRTVESLAVAQIDPPEQERPVSQSLTIASPKRRSAWLYIISGLLILILIGSAIYIAFSGIGRRGPAPAGDQEIDASVPGMVLIQSGWLKMGSLEGYDYEQPVHEVYVNSFYIDETEVTNEQFEQFVNATNYQTETERTSNNKNSWRIYATPERKNHPVVLVSWNDAAAYAKWAGKRLPTEAEWEYAARGGLIGKKYPWGDDAPPRRANFARGRRIKEPLTEPVKSYESNGYGLYDMAGNVSEWCQDWYDPDYYHNSPERNPAGPSTGQSRVIRGGSWYTDFNQIRVAGRISETPEGYEYDRGFRCARSK
jgi:eukaryotic-like serine/threonine-protein kinase